MLDFVHLNSGVYLKQPSPLQTTQELRAWKDNSQTAAAIDPSKKFGNLKVEASPQYNSHQEEYGSTSSSSGGSSQNRDIGVFDHLAPLVGFTSAFQTSSLKLYSLRADKTIHIFRFASPIVKFLTCLDVQSTTLSEEASNKPLIVLLQEGLLKIFNLQTMEQEMSIRTF